MRSVLTLLTVWMIAGTAAAQTRFELTAPTLNKTSQATLTTRQLRVVDQEGRETVYSRNPNLDSADGLYVAYQEGPGGQVIRWPVANSGAMQIGNNVAGRIEFRTSQMQIVALDQPVGPGNTPRPNRPPPIPRDPRDSGDPATQPVLPPSRTGVADGGVGPDNQFFYDILRDKDPQPQVMRLAIRDDRGRDWFLGKSTNNRLAMHGAANPSVADWHIVPAGRGYVRVSQRIGQDWFALAATPARALTIDPLGQQAAQLWRVMLTQGYGNGYWLESAILPGYALTGAVSGAVSLLPVNGSFGQVWLPQPVVIAPGVEPLWKSVSHEVRPNPALPPAQIELINSHSSALRILVGDQRGGQAREIRIEPQSRVLVPFDRDPGATVVETYELRGPSGVWDRQQFVTQIPPTPIYDLSVYEEFLQSIAIDRTGTSPNTIEDINYQPKSVGWLPLPPGQGLPSRGQIDAYEDAKAANNPGAVRRFDPRALEKPSTQPDPLQDILDRNRKKF